jgi:LysM repeat protein
MLPSPSVRRPTVTRAKLGSLPLRTALLACLAAATCFLAEPTRATAQSEHRVAQGQTLARIARRYGVPPNSLAGANGLGRGQALRPGQVLRIPENGTYYVGPGDTLASIARSQRCSIEELRRLNRLGRSTLQLGQRLMLPGFVEPAESETAARDWGRPRTPGTVTLLRQNQRLRVRLINRRGRVDRDAERRLRDAMRLRGREGPDGLGPPPPRRLIEMLARVSDHFGGRLITLVSGYRPPGGNTRETSRHVQGHAIDFRIQDVPISAIRDFLRANFDRVGVGYYPRSDFVHLDARDRSAYWVDYSGPGERPRTRRRGSDGGGGTAEPRDAQGSDSAPEGGAEGH